MTGCGYNNQFSEEELATEIWKDIPGWIGLYQVSNLGRVKSLERKVKNSSNTYRVVKERTLIVVLNDKGYFYVNLNKNGVSKHYLVSTLVASAFISIRPQNMECCHNDGNPLNNRLDNLRWDTHKNNHIDSVKHGTFLYGENHPNSKLKDEQIIEIKKMYETGLYYQKEIGKIYGLSKSQISGIINNQRRIGLKSA